MVSDQAGYVEIYLLMSALALVHDPPNVMHVQHVRLALLGLVADEVMSGFRVALGGAQERFGVTPDMTTLGKIDIQGPDAAEFLNRIYTNAWLKLPVGSCDSSLIHSCSSFICDASRGHSSTGLMPSPRLTISAPSSWALAIRCDSRPR